MQCRSMADNYSAMSKVHAAMAATWKQIGDVSAANDHVVAGAACDNLACKWECEANDMSDAMTEDA